MHVSRVCLFIYVVRCNFLTSLSQLAFPRHSTGCTKRQGTDKTDKLSQFSGIFLPDQIQRKKFKCKVDIQLAATATFLLKSLMLTMNAS